MDAISNSLGSRSNVWIGRGIWAVTDQGLFAGSNFFLNILLARWLNPEGYGAFATAFAMFLLFSTFYTAFLIEPMLVFGPSKYRKKLTEYMEILVVFHWMTAGVLGSLMLGVGFWVYGFRSEPVGGTIILFALAMPFVLLQWLMRRACYVQVNPSLAAFGGSAYALLIVAGTWVLYLVDKLSSVTAVALMGVASCVVAVFLARRLGVGIIRLIVGDGWRAVWSDHWAFGRWGIGAQLAIWLRYDVFFLVLPATAGLEATGGLRAICNLLLPIQHINVALGPVLLPALVTARNDRIALLRRIRVATGGFFAGGVSFWIVLALFHRPLVTLVYSGKYDEYSSFLIWLGAVSLCSGISTVSGAALRAVERPDRVFWASGISALLAVTAAVTLAPLMGVRGAAIGVLVASAVSALALAITMWNTVVREKPLP